MTTPERPRKLRKSPGPWEPPAPAMQGAQFHRVYRGMWLSAGYGEHPPKTGPHDDEGLLKRMKPAPYSGGFYGPHWTTTPETARRFATGTESNLDPYAPGSLKATHDHHVVGVVLEAHTTQPPSVRGYQRGFGEDEVAHPRAEHVQRVVAHVHELKKLDDVGGDLLGRHETFVRSFEVPREHWRGA